MRRSLILGLACVAPLAGAALAQADRALSVEQTAVEAVRPSDARVEISGTLTDPDGIYHVGDTVGLTVRLSQQAHLTVLNVDESGRVTQLFPNQFHPDSLVAGGQDLPMPGKGARITAPGPAGVEVIKIIASDRPIDLEAVGPFVPAGPFTTSEPGTAGRLARALAVEPLAEPAPEPSADTPAAEVPEATPPDGAAPVDVAGAAMIWGELTMRVVIQDAVPVAPAAAAPAADTPAPAAGAPAALASDFGLTLQSLQSRYRVGDELRFRVAADRPCNLMMVAVGPGGNSDLLVPNAALVEVRLFPGSPQEIGGLRATDPVGAHAIVAQCAEIAEAAVPADGSIDVAVANEPAQPATGARDIKADPAAAAAPVARATLEIEIVE